VDEYYKEIEISSRGHHGKVFAWSQWIDPRYCRVGPLCLFGGSHSSSYQGGTTSKEETKIQEGEWISI